MNAKNKKRTAHGVSQKNSRKTVSDSSKIDAQSIAVLNKIIVFAPGMFPRLKSEDKTPNGDGCVDIMNANKEVIGTLEVQARSLSKGKRKISCPCYLIDHAEHSALPFLFIGVDRFNNTAYWKQLSASMPEYRSDQSSFTITFDDDDIIDESHRFCEPWTKIASSRANLPNEWKELQRALLSEVADESRKALQEYIDVINSEFDAHWYQIKRQFFPALWKFGVLLIQYQPEQSLWVYQIYSVRKGGNAPLVMAGKEIDPHGIDEDTFGRNAFTTHFTRIFNPVKDGFEFVHSIVSDALSVNFFEPDSETCLVEQAWATFRHFPVLTGVTKGKELQLARLLEQLSALDVNALDIPAYYLSNFTAFRDKGIFACQRLLSLGKEAIKNPYVGVGCPIAMCEGQTQTALDTNLKLVLNQLLPEYQRFLKYNALSFLGERWFDQSLAIIFAIKARPDGTLTYDEYFVEYKGNRARIRIVDHSKVNAKDMFLTKSVIIEGKKFNLHSMTQRAVPTQIFSYTPLRDIILQMLKKDIDKYFKAARAQTKEPGKTTRLIGGRST